MRYFVHTHGSEHKYCVILIDKLFAPEKKSLFLVKDSQCTQLIYNIQKPAYLY
jgi:hypothetical protein